LSDQKAIAHNLVADNDGSLYEVGSFKDSIRFDLVKLVCPSTNIYLVKYSSNGNVLWARNTIGGKDIVPGEIRLTCDHKGAIYIASCFSDSIIIGNQTIKSFVNSDVDNFIAKFDTSGNCLWAIRGGAPNGGDVLKGLACDSSGNVYAIGNSFTNTLHYSNDSLLNPGAQLSYIVKIRSNGTIVWLKTIQPPPCDVQPMSIAVDKKNSIYVAGYFSKTTTIAGTVFIVPSPTGPRIFTARLDSSGNPLWASSSNVYQKSLGNCIAVGKSGDIYTFGRLAGSGSFDTIPVNLKNHRMQDFVVAYNPNGRALWLRNWDSNIDSNFIDLSAIVLDNTDNIFLTSFFGETTIIGTDTLASSKSSSLYTDEVYIAALTNEGKYRWAKQGKGKKNDFSMGISLCAPSSVYVCGNFIDSVTFDTIKKNGQSPTLYNPYTVKITSPSITIQNVQGAPFCSGTTITVPFKKIGSFQTANTFYLQISDSTGNFIKGRLIDSLHGTTDSVFHSQLPFDLATSTKYRLRIVGSLPLTFGTDNGTDIRIFAAPKITFDPPSPVKVCGLKSPLPLKATAVGGTSYIWRDGPSGSSRTVTKAGWYYVTTENANACERTDSILVIDEPAVTAKITPTKPITFCEGNTTGLLASGGQFFRWSTGDTTKLLVAGKQGWYKVTVTDTNGCSGIDSIFLTVLPAPKISMDPTGTRHICPGDTIVLTASLAPNYLWSTGDTMRSITIDSAGKYYVSTKDSNCTGLSETLIVYEYSVPEKPLITRDGAILRTTAPTPLQWYLNGQPISGGTGQSITVTEEGDYTVIATNTNGCTASSNNYHFSFSGVKFEKELPVFTVVPNPATTTIKVTISSETPQRAKIELLSVLGERIVELFNGELTKEKKEISYVFPARVGEGVYFVRMEAGSGVKTIKLVKK
jgi:hypothetical protein